MRPSVRSAFITFTTPLEGRVNYMYLDVKGLVTTGVGNLIDNPSDAQRLPWFRGDMQKANPGEIADAWNTVKKRKDLALQGGGVYKKLTSLRLSETAVDALVYEKLDEMDKYLTGRFPAYKDFPADGQLALLSMSWALGPAFKFPKFEAALSAGDFMLAAEECRIRGEGTISQRNIANKLMFVNAARVTLQKSDHDILHYPKIVPSVPCPTCGR